MTSERVTAQDEAEYERDLNGEAIMLVREHLAAVGIERPFFDDVGAIAAHTIRTLRQENDALASSCWRGSQMVSG